MNILLLVSGGRGPKTIDLSERKNQIFGFLFLFVLFSLLLAAGFLAGTYIDSDKVPNDESKWYSSLIVERQSIQKISQQTTNDLDALAISLGSTFNSA